MANKMHIDGNCNNDDINDNDSNSMGHHDDISDYYQLAGSVNQAPSTHKGSAVIQVKY